MGEKKTSFGQLLSVMPEGREEKAKELGALPQSREIGNATDLPRPVFLCLAEGKSFGGTAALLKLAGIGSMTGKAVFTRFQKCGGRRRRLCENIYRNNRAIPEPPPGPGDKKVYPVDAGDGPVHGSDKADYRPRYAAGLFDPGMKEMAPTGTGQGEKPGNFKTFGKDDPVIGDRAYRGKQGTGYPRGTGSGFVPRFGTGRFRIYNENGSEVNILGYLKGLKPGESGEVARYYEYGGEYRPLRFCVLRKTGEAERKGLGALGKTRMRKYGNKELSKAQRAYNRYAVAVTPVTDAAPDVILGLYRQRWQIEPVFKRLKLLFGYHEIPVHVERSAMAWFYGKLLLAALCETRVNTGRFSPSAGNCSA
jgi:hypothetical protein